MNVFATHPDPYICAANLDDSRVVKMYLESVQMLCTVAHFEGHIMPYKPAHPHNGLIRWLQNDRKNVFWLIAHAVGLKYEYGERFGREHACNDVLSALVMIFGYEKSEPLAFLNKAANKEHNLDFTHIQDVFTAYRLYLDARWNKAIRDHAENPRKRLPKWTNKKPPIWYTLETLND